MAATKDGRRGSRRRLLARRAAPPGARKGLAAREGLAALEGAPFERACARTLWERPPDLGEAWRAGRPFATWAGRRRFCARAPVG